RGLEIPVRAGQTARTAGLPDVQPCAPLYRLLLERGRPQPGRAVSATAAADLVAWLPEDLRSPTAALLSSGHRLAQEWIGYQTLQANDRPSV
ncbi:MAG: Wadjet anti-phage system protein JetD domain-containing protein, partial [Egibacteraceae bacterium]